MNLYHVDVRKAVQTGANVRRQLYNARDFATVKEDAIDNRLNTGTISDNIMLHQFMLK